MESLSRKSAAHLLADRRIVQNLRRDGWAARIPVVLSAMALAWLTTAFGMWAFGRRAGFYAGLCISTCFGLFLFTRILIPDVMLTACIALSMWAFLRAIDEGDERRPRWWAFVLAASLGTSLLFKSLIGVVFPVAAALVYLGVTRQLFDAKSGSACIRGAACWSCC
jgi:4-amino-4-deoxy-L-arabinose transferase-like glycosyltransferase